MNYYLINPLYQGDISLDSTFENGKVTKLVYELDEIWNGDLLVCGTDEFICEHSLAEKLISEGITGFTVSDMTTYYSGSLPVPEFKRMNINGKISIKRKKYQSATADICITGNAGELAVSEKAYNIIGMKSENKIEPYKEKTSYSYYLKTPVSFGELTDSLPDDVSISFSEGVYEVSGANQNKVLLFLSCLESEGVFIGEAPDKLMEFELFFLHIF